MNILYTERGEQIKKNSLENEQIVPLDEYPRPTLIRDNSHLILNGWWDFCTEQIDNSPTYDKKILVPFSPESALSGIGKHFKEGTKLFYRRYFTIPEGFYKDKIILHIGAIDQKAVIYINEQKAGEHIGGYDSFSIDITKYITKGNNRIEIQATDNLKDKSLPYGKQRIKRKGMWYTPVSGIWQTIWIENVPQKYIDTVEFSISENNVLLKTNDNFNGKITVESPDGTETIQAELKNGKSSFNVDKPQYWTPESPYLYHVTINASAEESTDVVKTYFAFRTLETKEVNGINFLCLNGKPYFFHGLLDQGYWSDGIYTPPSYKCFEDDIRTAKSLGFNTLRKHIKLEPERFYYECDRLGIVVFQDMINNGSYNFIRDTALPTIGMKKLNDKLLHRNKKTRQNFKITSEKIINTLKKHPSVCLWTIFNEGWGQFDGNAMYDFVKKIDNTRFVDTASGWFKCTKSDVESIHKYFTVYKHKKNKKPVILSEFGGYSYKIDKHSFNLENTYGYGKFPTKEQFNEAVWTLYKEQIIPAIKNGLCSDIYTQLSDVEDETNGIITYDRRVLKLSPEVMLDIKKDLDNEIDLIK